jgi:small subunit ribosomal protein S6
MENSLYRTYKTFIFLQPNLEKDGIFEVLTKYSKLLSSRKSYFSFQHLGTKLFSYPIKGFYSGTYIQLTFTGNGDLVEEINKQLSITESVIRYITIRKESKYPDIYKENK